MPWPRRRRYTLFVEGLTLHPNVASVIPKLKRKKPVDFPIAAAQELISCAAIPLGRRVRYMVAFTSSQRDGELSGRCWRHVKLDAKILTIEISDALKLRGDGGKLGIGRTKAESSERTIPLHPAGVVALRRWRDEGGWARASFTGADPGPSARLIKADLTLVAPQLAEAGIVLDGNIVFHTTRGALATWLTEARVPPGMIEPFIGHAGSNVTSAHYLGEVLPKMAEALAAIPLSWSVHTAPKVTPDPSEGSHKRKPLASNAPMHGGHLDTVESAIGHAKVTTHSTFATSCKTDICEFKSHLHL
jgi:integrase